MSWHRAKTPICHPEHDHVVLDIEPRTRDIGAFDVRRALPSADRRMIGPFIFFDEMGPAELGPGDALTVRPHPHINLATVSYLFEGTIFHRDSLGSAQAIEPGAINWMVAGRGIAHSERSPEGEVQRTRSLHGIQLWVALPDADEETEPLFEHHPADSLPAWSERGAHLRLLLGSAYGRTAPVKVFSPMCYVEARLDAGAKIAAPTEYSECAVYLVDGVIDVGGKEYQGSRLLVLGSEKPIEIAAREPARVMILGGEPLGERHIWWNFVSSSKERIEQAKADWREGRFGTVAGDEDEFIPLPSE